MPLIILAHSIVFFLNYVFIMEYKQLTPMFYNSEFNIGYEVYTFMCGLYPNLKTVEIEVIPTDLTEDNVFGWTTYNNDQHEIEIHDTLSEKDFITTLSHELIHVDQNVRGLRDDVQREEEAYSLEHTLTNQFLNKC